MRFDGCAVEVPVRGRRSAEYVAGRVSFLSRVRSAVLGAAVALVLGTLVTSIALLIGGGSGTASEPAPVADTDFGGRPNLISPTSLPLSVPTISATSEAAPEPARGPETRRATPPAKPAAQSNGSGTASPSPEPLTAAPSPDGSRPDGNCPDSYDPYGNGNGYGNGGHHGGAGGRDCW